MPWFQEFVSAAELVRSQTRDAGQADPVGQYVAAISQGDAHTLEKAWPGEMVVHDPRWGEVRGHRELRHFIRYSKGWLAERGLAGVDTVATTVAGDRAVMELLAHLVIDGRKVAWPVAVVAESPDDRSVVFRTYLSLRALDGEPRVRAAILAPGSAPPGDVVGRYQAALTAGDTAEVVATFEPDGYYREPAGASFVHRGAGELGSFFTACFGAGGGIGLVDCAVTDDGVRCAVEYNCVRWGAHDLPPQAGIGVFERGTDGLLAAARVYDDVAPPARE